MENIVKQLEYVPAENMFFIADRLYLQTDGTRAVLLSNINFLDTMYKECLLIFDATSKHELIVYMGYGQEPNSPTLSVNGLCFRNREDSILISTNSVKKWDSILSDNNRQVKINTDEWFLTDNVVETKEVVVEEVDVETYNFIVSTLHENGFQCEIIPSYSDCILMLLENSHTPDEAWTIKNNGIPHMLSNRYPLNNITSAAKQDLYYDICEIIERMKELGDEQCV